MIVVQHGCDRIGVFIDVCRDDIIIDKNCRCTLLQGGRRGARGGGRGRRRAREAAGAGGGGRGRTLIGTPWWATAGLGGRKLARAPLISD